MILILLFIQGVSEDAEFEVRSRNRYRKIEEQASEESMEFKLIPRKRASAGTGRI
jgi:hypothetical protein